MKKKLLLTITVVLLFGCFFAISTYAVEIDDLPFTSGNFYLEKSDDLPGLYFVYQTQDDLNADEADDGQPNSYLAILCLPSFQDTLDDVYNDYTNLPVYDEETGYNGYDSFGDYFSQIGSELNGNERLNLELSGYIEYKESQESAEDSSGSEDSGSGGGSEGDSGSDSTGTENGTPNVDVSDIPPDMSEEYNCAHYGSSGYSGPCECFISGFQNGWGAAMNSDEIKAALQEAFDQGFRLVNTQSYQDKLANERELAVEEYLKSEDYEKSIEEAKTTAISEYRSSDKYVEDFKSEENSETEKQKINEIKESVIEEFKNSDEQLEIIGQAKEGAKADLVVEMESVLSGDSEASEGAASDMRALVETKIKVAQEEAVGDFVDSMESIMSGESTPTEGTPEAELNESITQNVNVAFQEGIEQGEAQFKLSLEYKTSLETEYKAGSEAGYQQGFLIGTNDGYADGLLDGAELANEELYNKGKTEYMNTEEYQNTIQNTYDQGYNDGSEASSNPASIIVPVVVVCGLLIVVMVISANQRKKKHK